LETVFYKLGDFAILAEDVDEQSIEPLLAQLIGACGGG